MSVAIDVDKVISVLLGDGWHSVADDSFLIDSYEYLEGGLPEGLLVHGGGQSGICASGFSFYEELDQDAGGAFQGDLVRVSGPLTAIRQ